MLELGEAHETGHRGGRRGRRRDSSTCSSSSATTRAAIADGALATPGWSRRGSTTSPDDEDALEILRPRLRDGDMRPGQGVARDRPRPPGRRAPARARGAADVTVELIQGLLLAFALVVILMPSYIRLLQRLGFGKRIRGGGSGEPLCEGGHADDGRPARSCVVVLGDLLLPAPAGRRDLRAAGCAGRGRSAGRLRRLPQRQDRARGSAPARSSSG